MKPDEVEERIKEMFAENYKSLRLAGGHALTEDIQQLALNQVIAYYRKLRHIAEQVTETEVKLTLPNQISPNGNKFNIEGVVDIVQEGDDTPQPKVVMYDLKTHDADYIRKHTDFYESQLNVYAHVWQNLRNNQLDKTAIISTALPNKVKNAFRMKDEIALEKAFKEWDPVIEIKFKEENVTQTINEFAKVVDNIEDRVFSAPDLERLKMKEPGTNVQFATYVCRNCDARFSCSSYRDYVKQSGARSLSDVWKYLEDTGDVESNEERILACLERG